MSKIKVRRVSSLLQEGFDKEKIAEAFVDVNKKAWPPPVPERYLWTREKVLLQIQHCPHMLYCAFKKDQIIGTLSSIHTTQNDVEQTKSWESISGNGTLSTHNEDGDVSFGLDLSVDPKFRGLGAQDILIQKAFLICVVFGKKKGVFLGSRAPKLHRQTKTMSAEDHIFGKNGKSRDPEVRMYQTEGFFIRKIIPGYMEDPDSLDYGVLMFYPNPTYTWTKWIPLFIMGTLGNIVEKIY
ncbi:MAG: GNAT family N-acetyltransferase [Candidatus Moranbacteria bacterium]|nr:GNAT family N-acetyltransferase [Candidatus Moranbacteria bacterium]